MEKISSEIGNSRFKKLFCLTLPEILASSLSNQLCIQCKRMLNKKYEWFVKQESLCFELFLISNSKMKSKGLRRPLVSANDFNLVCYLVNSKAVCLLKSDFEPENRKRV